MFVRYQKQTMQEELQNEWKKEKEKWKMIKGIMKEQIKKSDEILNFLNLMQNLILTQQIQNGNVNQRLLENAEIENKERHKNVMETLEQQYRMIKECTLNTIWSRQYKNKVRKIAYGRKGNTGRNN
jgi:hypothetical protein